MIIEKGIFRSALKIMEREPKRINRFQIILSNQKRINAYSKIESIFSIVIKTISKNQCTVLLMEIVNL